MNDQIDTETERQLLDIPVAPVDQWYTMDPNTEDLVLGAQLHVGNIILLEDQMMRGSLTDLEMFKSSLNEGHQRSVPFLQAKIDVTNHWCRILEIHRYGDIQKFIALYANGVKRSFSYNESWAWIVKK